MSRSTRVAVVQAASVFFDKEACIDRIATILNEHKEEQCELFLFPETFIPGYPRGFSFGTTMGSRSDAGRDLYEKYYQQSIEIDGPELERICALSKQYNCYLVVGITERCPENGSLYCSILYVSPYSGLLGVHRKIKPTGLERVVWAEAGPESLVTFNTPIGKLGGLICWENYMPLARMSMYSKGVEIYLAPTADSRENWISTMKHIALEGRCFVLSSNQYFDSKMYPKAYRDLLQDEVEFNCSGGSCIISPLGEVLAGPLRNEAGVLIADLELNQLTKAKLDFDVNGHYNRKDLFNFSVPGQPEIHNEVVNDEVNG